MMLRQSRPPPPETNGDLTLALGREYSANMGATAEIRGLCDQSAQTLRNALLAYAKGSRRAP